MTLEELVGMVDKPLKPSPMKQTWDKKAIREHYSHLSKSELLDTIIGLGSEGKNLINVLNQKELAKLLNGEFVGDKVDDHDIVANGLKLELKCNVNQALDLGKTIGFASFLQKEDWDYIGGNDPLFAPASWDDKDIFLRSLLKDIKLILTTTSVVWHFGARGSHRLEENQGQTSKRQREAEIKNYQKWLTKWNKYPTFDNVGMIQKDNMKIINSYKGNYR